MDSYADIDGLFVEGSWNAEFADETKPAENDVIIKNRDGFCAFTGTDLQSVLEKKNIQRIFITGFLTDMAIEETVIQLSELMPGIAKFVLIDGCAAMSKEAQFNALGSVLPTFSTLITCSEAQSLLRLAPPSMTSEVSRGINARDSLLIANPRRESGPSFRPRILALHGAGSNDEVTRLQLDNLWITEEDYDIVYLRGSIEVEEGDPELEGTGLVFGPFYSWLDKDEEKRGASLITAVRDVLTVAKNNGPFDGIYGFSSGGHVAALASAIATDPSLQQAIQALEADGVAKNSRKSVAGMLGLARGGTRRLSGRQSTFGGTNKRLSGRQSIAKGVNKRMSGRQSIAGGVNKRMSGRQSRTSMFRAAPVLKDRDFIAPPFRFVVLACSASPTPDLATLRKSAALRPTQLQPGSMTTKSFHLIGIEDGFKVQSEEMATFFAYRHVRYLPGGHIVSRDERSDEELCLSLRVFMRSLGSPPPSAPYPKFVPMSEVSSIALLPHIQVALVKLNHDLLPGGSLTEHRGGATIKALLEAQPQEKPFLYNARGTDLDDVTTYGDVFNFIHGGAGDLRRLGVEAGDVVAYAAPPGGGAAAALAFLSIGAQTAAAPLAPNTAEPDALDALNQFKANHLLLFDGVDCPGVEKAFETYAANGKAKIHRATIVSGGRPGMFEFTRAKEIEGRPLANPVNGTCLLLRTSGTTARPKGVPLQQGALVTNGAILAASMGLQESDVCYSCMPLFHIGGISASILCTLASGGSVSCDSELFDPSRMVDALGISRPQPTWYSSVPTIHNATVTFLKDLASSDPKYTAYGINSEGIWSEGHSLRMIRSGAAALLGPDGDSLAAAYGGVPIYPTYSMSEQMPISQPPAGKTDTFTAKKGSVGVPVAASTAIVSRGRLRLQPRGVEGEIAISGPTVLENYLDNPAADSKAYFYLTLPMDGSADDQMVENDRYFLTGDIGTIDDEGFLTLKGRAKELIKKGGEQVSPFEVEEPLLTHPWVKTPVCFAVPSKLYGEEVGCALVLSSQAPHNVEQREVIVAMRGWLKEAKLASVKWPTKWVICADSDLPKTKTKKYIRIGLSTVLGLDPEEDDAINTKESKEPKAKMDWGTLGGLRFTLACYVMFMHIGSTESWGRMANLRGFPWHVHVFFTLGGYSLASPMNPVIQKKVSYFITRIGSMYPMYAVALFLANINLLVVCRPSTFSKVFHWDSQPYDLKTADGDLAPLFCKGTPATPNSYWASLALTVLTYIVGMAVTPFWPLVWNMGYYLWFNSMFFQCLAIFPALYNALFNGARKNARLLLQVIVALMVLNVVIICGAWFGWKDKDGYKHYDPATGEKNNVEEYNDASAHNIAVLSFYLFGPFWVLYFVIGACTAFLYDAYRPAERHNAWVWGYVADGCTLILLALSATYIAQGTQTYGELSEAFSARPDEANESSDTLATSWIWDNMNGRLMCPLTTLWIFSLSTGQGITAALFRQEFLVGTLSPNSYNCFLFHQMVAQWYYAATRRGIWWNWWRYRKTFYWFSADPCPVGWYEYFFVVVLVVGWSQLMMILEPLVLGDGLDLVKAFLTGSEAESDEEMDTSKVLCDLIEGMTGIEPLPDWTLEECGLASIGVPVLVSLLNKAFSRKGKALMILARDLITAKTIGDMTTVVDDFKKRADAKGV